MLDENIAPHGDYRVISFQKAQKIVYIELRIIGLVVGDECVVVPPAVLRMIKEADVVDIEVVGAVRCD